MDTVPFLIGLSVPGTFICFRTRLIIKEQRALHVKWDEFLRPFTRRLWLLQLFSMFLIGLCFGVTYHVGQRLGLEAGVESILQNIYDALFYTFASFCQQGKTSYREH
jgi:hypothetical protein